MTVRTPRSDTRRHTTCKPRKFLRLPRTEPRMTSGGQILLKCPSWPSGTPSTLSSLARTIAPSSPDGAIDKSILVV